MGEGYVHNESPDFQKGVDSKGKFKLLFSLQYILLFCKLLFLTNSGVKTKLTNINSSRISIMKRYLEMLRQYSMLHSYWLFAYKSHYLIIFYLLNYKLVFFFIFFLLVKLFIYLLCFETCMEKLVLSLLIYFCYYLCRLSFLTDTRYVYTIYI